MKAYKHLATDDYQNRNGNFPKSDIPTSITVSDDKIQLSFKSTTEKNALKFAEKFVSSNIKEKVVMSARQDGDYEDDWVDVDIRRAK